MSYCPKCGNKVDETMTFCPRCGASLKMETPGQGLTGTQAPPYEYRYRHRNEKQEKPEKDREKHEKRGGGFGYLIAGIIVIFLGVLGYINATSHILSGAVASALVLVVIGILILIAGLYYYTRSKSRNPIP